MTLKNFILVAVGGSIGSVLRYLFAVTIKHEYFPFSTFIVNILGSFIIGLIMGIASKHAGFGEWRLFLATGICGGFTTFSSFSWESINLLEQQRYLSFTYYLTGTLFLGLTATLIGYLIIKQF
ncbi:MAG: fluoride efflux transporter CrcB [Bacteroidota bacterium]|nr:fluoride efflux transporter CrcB [Bacteroidota bacterium]